MKEIIISCKGDGELDDCCEYDGIWFCRNLNCKHPVPIATLLGARPNGCPKVDKWNRKDSDMK